MKFVIWILGIPIAIAVVAFAIANRVPVPLRFDPLPYELDVPIWITVIGSLAIGFVIGSLCKWLFDYRYRSELRQGRKLIRGLEKEIFSLRKRLNDLSDEPRKAQKVQLEQKSFSSFQDKV